MTVAQWYPLVDISEDDKEYLIKAELPEVKKDEVKVMVENGVLSISGERKFEKEEKNKKYHRVERAYGSLCGALRYPMMRFENVKAESKTACSPYIYRRARRPNPNNAKWPSPENVADHVLEN